MWIDSEPDVKKNFTEQNMAKTDGEVLEPIKVLRADIDYNKHLNNANYVRMAMELTPQCLTEFKGLSV